ncbi:MAG TPA: translesion error-prone DNA polymerase V autoproteolytic subunit [Desulfurivibrionaceae bacterium]|nr:translesion error-prone DNA polymerase V autoproteolytic subunit [Desulfurivibrionaceae bacterium]
MKTLPITMPTDATISAIHGFDQKGGLPLPLFLCRVSAGFPSPAADHLDKCLNLNELLIKHPAATFFVRVAGDSMTGAGINHDDILIVDRALEPANGKVVIAVLNGELTVKRLFRNGELFRLAAENPDYPDLQLAEGESCEIWGVVSFVIHSL